MGREGLLVGELARHTGVSRKALRVYEASRILPPARRTASGYRVYGADAPGVVTFVKQAQRLGFRLDEIRDIVAIRRSGGVPCDHVRGLVRRKLADLETIRRGLRGLLRSWPSRDGAGATICPHIERTRSTTNGRTRDGKQEDVAVPVLRRVPRGRDRRR